MRMLILAGGVAVTTLLAGADAQAGSWCAWYDAYTYNCGFYSYRQCLATVAGAGGACRPNVQYEGPRQRRRHRGNGW